MTELHQAAAAVAPQLLAGPLAAAAMAAAATGGGASAEAAAEGDPQLQRWRLLGKNWERLLQVALVTMDRCVCARPSVLVGQHACVCVRGWVAGMSTAAFCPRRCCRRPRRDASMHICLLVWQEVELRGAGGAGGAVQWWWSGEQTPPAPHWCPITSPLLLLSNALHSSARLAPRPGRHTFQFAAHLPALLSLCINACLLAMDASLVHHMR